MPESAEPKKKVAISVAQRQGYQGVYAIGELFPSGGPYEREVTAEQLEILKGKSKLGLVVMEVGVREAKPSQPAVPPKGEGQGKKE